MIRDIKQYWREIRVLEAELPDFVWLAVDTGKDPGKRSALVLEATRANAARLLHQKTHRKTTDSEVAGFLAREKTAKHAARINEMRRDGRALVLLSDEGAD